MKIALAIMIGLVTVSQGAVYQWPISEGGNGHSYEVVFVSGGISWTAAKNAAENKGGYLATITSAEEEIWIQHLINDPAYWHESSTKSLYGPWIGGYQVPGSGEPVGEWRWVTGESFEFTNWLPNSPDNSVISGCGNQNSLHYFRYPPSASIPIAAWNDQQDDCPPWIPWSYVIEYSSFVVRRQ
jgi:hypothetical protein